MLRELHTPHYATDPRESCARAPHPQPRGSWPGQGDIPVSYPSSLEPLRGPPKFRHGVLTSESMTQFLHRSATTRAPFEQRCEARLRSRNSISASGLNAAKVSAVRVASRAKKRRATFQNVAASPTAAVAERSTVRPCQDLCRFLYAGNNETLRTLSEPASKKHLSDAGERHLSTLVLDQVLMQRNDSASVAVEQLDRNRG